MTANATNATSVSEKGQEQGKGKGKKGGGPPVVVVAERFSVLEKIGSGSFGEVYAGLEKKNGVATKVAIKFESRHTKTAQLQHENTVYRVLGGGGGGEGGGGVPRSIWFGDEGSYRVLVLPMLGPSLQALFKKCRHKFSLSTVMRLAIEMVNLLEYVHDHGYLHRDVKPDNFLFPAPHADRRRCIHSLYLIDFGLSKPYMSTRGSYLPSHIRFTEGGNLVGTPRYSSMRAHDGAEQGRRDDMTSLGHVLVYFLKGSLPWQESMLDREKTYDKFEENEEEQSTNKKKKDKKEEHSEKDKRKNERIKQKKRETSAEELCDGLPEEMFYYMKYVNGMDFEEEPDYQGIRRMFHELSCRHQFNCKDEPWDWEKRDGRYT